MTAGLSPGSQAAGSHCSVYKVTGKEEGACVNTQGAALGLQGLPGPARRPAGHQGRLLFPAQLRRAETCVNWELRGRTSRMIGPWQEPRPTRAAEAGSPEDGGHQGENEME